MATTLTAPESSPEELTYSFGIQKFFRDEDGDLVVTGVATDGSVDADRQVVLPEWSGPALKTWLDTGGNVRMSHDARRPIGKGVKVELDRDGDGKHWVTTVVVDKDAQRLIEKGVLTAYSVGISHPVIKRDPSGQAPGGIICGGELTELSIVDRPSCKNAYLQLAKAAADGSAEFTGKVVGADDPIVKAALEDDSVTLELPADVSVAFSPADLAKLVAHKRQAQKRQEAALTKAATVALDGKPVATVPVAADPDLALKAIGAAEAEILGKKSREFSAEQRRQHAKAGNALPDGSYPIPDADALRRAAILARSRHGNWRAAMRLIARRAKELGVPNPLKKKPKAEATKAAEPDLTKCGPCGGTGMVDGKPCTECKKGRKLAKKAQRAAKAGAVKKKKKKKVTCQSCGAMQNRKHAMCTECGASLAAAPPVTKNHDFACLNCGHKPLDKGEKHCPSCGKENPGYTPLADRKIPMNAAAEKGAKGEAKKKRKKARKGKSEPFGGKQAPPFGKDKDSGEAATKAGKGRVVKRSKKSGKKGKGVTPAQGGHVAGERREQAAGPHREPDGAAVEAFEADSHMSDGDHEKPSHLAELAGSNKAAKRKKAGKGKRPEPQMPPEGDDSDVEKAATFEDPQLQATMRMKTLGIPLHMGIAHDLTCPAFLPAEVDLCYPGVTLKNLDLAEWSDDALEKAAGANLEEAMATAEVLQAITTLRHSDPADIADIREGAYKMFRDANGARPAPSHFPTPTQIGPAQFHRPLITAGHEAASPGHDAPHHVKLPEIGGISAEDYTRGYLSEGHAADSPANTHPAPPSPTPDHAGAQTGNPARVFYRNSVREGDEHAMRTLHDHISSRFPAVCPMHPHFASTPVPTPAGVPEVAPAPGTKKGKKNKAAKAAKARKAAARKMRRRVLKNAPKPPVMTALDPQAIEVAISKATAPLLERLTEQGNVIKTQGRRLRKQAKAIDAIAGQPDTSHAPYRGVALTKQASPSPAGTASVAKSAEQVAADNYARLYSEWATTTDPAAQEALARVLLPYWHPAMRNPHAPQA